MPEEYFAAQKNFVGATYFFKFRQFWRGVYLHNHVILKMLKSTIKCFKQADFTKTVLSEKRKEVLKMSRRYLRSDMSEQEARFFTCGCALFGEENHLTGIFKLIGKFNELEELGRKGEIIDYFPERDKRFKFENRGYTDMSKMLKKKYPNWHLSRKCLKNLSRKWIFTPVVISVKSDSIIYELITYIKKDADLKTACENYLKRFGSEWKELMPIQFDFLSTRHTDEHKNYRVAGRIINEMANIRL